MKSVRFRLLRDRRPRSGFTLPELLVAMAVLALLILLFSQTTSESAKVWTGLHARVAAFEEARAGFESMTRKISQASLNTYWDYTYSSGTIPSAYVRQSDLHFICGSVSNGSNALQELPLLHTVPNLNATTHAIFFAAPVGYTQTSVGTAPTLGKLVNACGYVISHSVIARPPFINALPAFATQASRYRLMELWQPTEQFEEYYDYANYLKTPTTITISGLCNWYYDAVNNGGLHALAQNVLALVIWPRRSVQDTGSLLTANYIYDSRNYTRSTSDPTFPQNTTYAPFTRNQLPPVVQVTMVAIDEASAARLETLGASSHTSPLLAANTLFTSLGAGTTVTAQTVNYTNDMNSLIAAMTADRLNYRVYTTSVTINQAKWSQGN